MWIAASMRLFCRATCAASSCLCISSIFSWLPLCSALSASRAAIFCCAASSCWRTLSCSPLSFPRRISAFSSPVVKSLAVFMSFWMARMVSSATPFCLRISASVMCFSFHRPTLIYGVASRGQSVFYAASGERMMLYTRIAKAHPLLRQVRLIAVIGAVPPTSSRRRCHPRSNCARSGMP